MQSSPLQVLCPEATAHFLHPGALFLQVNVECGDLSVLTMFEALDMHFGTCAGAILQLWLVPGMHHPWPDA